MDWGRICFKKMLPTLIMSQPMPGLRMRRKGMRKPAGRPAQATGLTMASRKAIPRTRSACRFAQ